MTITEAIKKLEDIGLHGVFMEIRDDKMIMWDCYQDECPVPLIDAAMAAHAAVKVNLSPHVQCSEYCKDEENRIYFYVFLKHDLW